MKTTGLGAHATTEVVHDPVMAEMLRDLKKTELAYYAQHIQEKKAEAAKNEKSFGNGFKKGFLHTASKK